MTQNKQENSINEKVVAEELERFIKREIEREKYLSQNSTEMEKNAKKILTWIAASKKNQTLISASLTEDGNATVLYEIGNRKAYRTTKNIEEVKAVLEYINENVCGPGKAITKIEVPRMNTPKLAYNVNIEFSK